MPACEHTVGFVPNHDLVSASKWNITLAAFIAKAGDTIEPGHRPHPGVVHEFNFCPACGAELDRVALGLMTYEESYAIHLACSHLYKGDRLCGKNDSGRT
ncbi:hypothetical protein NPS53_09260 [Pseudomonas putida]|uniref:hypothetical protein n=1 Tax=Pseudomonas putida TaxID=303 RepID=UPI002364A57A|nr:hypothetical protein [Pseudomonas putida]MDD2139764.1 hypothetical protein [Pseudomonas putida]HDS1721688.1 hypothetical protein [Pseudomonas putida]